MTHKDIYTKFMIEYDKANVTSSYPSLTEYEVATVLDKAYNALIAQKVTGNNYRRIGLEGDLKAITDLAPLIRTSTESLTSSTNTNVMSCHLPDGTSDSEKFLYFISAQLVRDMSVEKEGEMLPYGETGSWEFADANLPISADSTVSDAVYLIPRQTSGDKRVKIYYKDSFIKNFYYKSFKKISIPDTVLGTTSGNLTSYNVGQTPVVKRTLLSINPNLSSLVAAPNDLYLYIDDLDAKKGLLYPLSYLDGDNTVSIFENLYVCLPADSLEDEENITEEELLDSLLWYQNRSYEIFFQNTARFRTGKIYSYDEILNGVFSSYVGSKENANYSDMMYNFGPSSAKPGHIRFVVSSGERFSDDAAYDFVDIETFAQLAGITLLNDDLLWKTYNGSFDSFGIVGKQDNIFYLFTNEYNKNLTNHSVTLRYDTKPEQSSRYEPVDSKFTLGSIEDIENLINGRTVDAVGFVACVGSKSDMSDWYKAVDGGIIVKIITSNDRQFNKSLPYDGINPRPVPVKLVNHDVADKFIVSSYNLPWIKIPICYIEDYDMNIVYDPIDKPIQNAVSVTYIKTPHKFVKDFISSTSKLDSMFTKKTEEGVVFKFVTNLTPEQQQQASQGWDSWTSSLGAIEDLLIPDNTYTLKELQDLGLYDPNQMEFRKELFAESNYISIVGHDNSGMAIYYFEMVDALSIIDKPSDLEFSYFWYESESDLEKADKVLSDYYTFECNDTVAEELISLAVAFALENVESQRLNSKLNMRGLEA